MTTHPDSKSRAPSAGLQVDSGRSAPSARRSRAVPRLPRRYGQWAATVLFVLVTALAAGWVWQQRSDRLEVLAVGPVPVEVGTVIERGDLTVVEVAGVADTIGAAEVDSIVGSTAAVGLVPGQVLNPDMVSNAPIPGPGERVVGVELDATRVPSGLAPGDVVMILAVPPTGDASSRQELASPSVLADQVVVLSAARVEGAGTRLALVVTERRANRVAAFGAAGRVAVLQAPVAEGGGGD